MAVKFVPKYKNIFNIARNKRVSDTTYDVAVDIARTAQKVVRKTKKRSEWEIDEGLNGVWDVTDKRNLFRIERDETTSGRSRASVLVHSPDKVGRRDGKAALKKAYRFGSVEGIQAHAKKLKANRAAKSLTRFDTSFKNATGRDFIQL